MKIARGILICGTGIGVSIAANKVPGAYAALVNNVYQAQRAQLSNNANIITLGAQVTGIELAKPRKRVLKRNFRSGIPFYAKGGKNYRIRKRR